MGPRQSPEEGKGHTELLAARGLARVPHPTVAAGLKLGGHAGWGLRRPRYRQTSGDRGMTWSLTRLPDLDRAQGSGPPRMAEVTHLGNPG